MAQKLTRRAVLMQAVFVAAMGTGCHNAGETPPCAKEDVLETTVSKVAGAKDQRQATFNGEAHGRWNGNCNCVVNSGMTVTFWDTGRGEWECDVETYETNPSGDSTVTISLSVFDSAGILLFTTAGYASPEMDTPHAPYKWTQDFYFPKDKLGRIGRCTRRVTCSRGS